MREIALYISNCFCALLRGIVPVSTLLFAAPAFAGGSQAIGHIESSPFLGVDFSFIEAPKDPENFSISAGEYSYASDSRLNDSMQQRIEAQAKGTFYRAWGFFETGSRGSYGFDLDPIRARIEVPGILTDKNSQIWLGRVHPLEELRGSRPSAFSALGISWAQNQLDPLNPTVSGWAGAGGVVSITDHIQVYGLGSPLFIPNRSPSLGIDENGKSNPTRFTRTLPASVKTGNLEMPILYKIETGDLSKILLQPQAMVGTRVVFDEFETGVMGWSAPDPSPSTQITGTLKVDAVKETLDTAVVARPYFPRRNRVGTYLTFTQIYGAPEIQYQRLLNPYAGQQEQFISASWQALPGLDLNYLTRFSEQRSADPTMSDSFAGIHANHRLFKVVTLDQTVQMTLKSERNSYRVVEQVSYQAFRNFQVFAGISALGGSNNSWFGEWRQEDSIFGGIKCAI